MLRHASCTLLPYTILKLSVYYMLFHQWTSLSYKSSNVHVKSMSYNQIWQNFRCDEYLCKLGKEYLNASLCKFVIYSLQHSETFDVSHVFLPLTIAGLSTLKPQTGPFFWPTLYVQYIVLGLSAVSERVESQRRTGWIRINLCSLDHL